jgi:hypothetical protein
VRDRAGEQVARASHGRGENIAARRHGQRSCTVNNYIYAGRCAIHGGWIANVTIDYIDSATIWVIEWRNIKGADEVPL